MKQPSLLIIFLTFIPALKQDIHFLYNDNRVHTSNDLCNIMVFEESENEG